MEAKRFRAAEVATTSLALWWGLILILPYDTFHTSIAYNAMNGIASEMTWGIAVGVIGLAQLAGMVHQNLIIKKISLLAATFVWFFIAASFGSEVWFSTAVGTYFIIGCLTGWLFKKVGEQHGR